MVGKVVRYADVKSVWHRMGVHWWAFVNTVMEQHGSVNDG
jgi:hypothetical protein